MSTYQATTPPDGATCSMKGCASAAKVRVIIPPSLFTADGTDHSQDPNTWDTCDLHWPRFRDAAARNGHDVADITGDLARLAAGFAGWTVFRSDSGRLYASPPVSGPAQGVTVDAWLAGPLRTQMAALDLTAH